MRAARIRFGWAEIGPSIQFELGIPHLGVFGSKNEMVYLLLTLHFFLFGLWIE
jgi:hypothetical protein